MAVMNSGGLEQNRLSQPKPEHHQTTTTTVPATETKVQQQQQEEGEEERGRTEFTKKVKVDPGQEQQQKRELWTGPGSPPVVSSLNQNFSLTTIVPSSSSVVSSPRLGTLPILSSSSEGQRQQQYSTLVNTKSKPPNENQQSSSNNIIYPFTYSLISAACSPCIPYRSEISRNIDTSSSIFYTVPLPKKSAPGYLLGTPSILKPSFRQLEEPTRFITALSKAKQTSPPNIYTPPLRLLNNKNKIKLKIVESEEASSNQSTPPTERSVSSEPKTNFVSLAHQRKLKQGSTMPLRVRMSNTHYYYTDTSSKATQTEEELTSAEKRRKSSGAGVSNSRTNSARRSGIEKIDRSTSPLSTSPILQLSSAQYLKKIEDLEKITGHFVIQRFFTRTDQNFGTWLEQQLAAQQQQSNSSKTEEIGKTVELEEGGGDDMIIIESQSETKSKSGEIESDNQNVPLTSQPLLPLVPTTATNDPEKPQPSLIEDNEIIDETQQLEKDEDEEDGKEKKEIIEIIPSAPPISSLDLLEELEQQIIVPEQQQQCQQLNQGSSDIVILVDEEKDAPQISDVPRPPVIDEMEDVIEDLLPMDNPPEEIIIIPQQEHVTVRLEPLGEGNEKVEEEENQKGGGEEVEEPLIKVTTTTTNSIQSREKQCKLSDVVPCECFAKFFFHEESIAKLLISFSPRTSTPITNTIDNSSFPTSTATEQAIDPLESFEKFEEALQTKKSHTSSTNNGQTGRRNSGKKRPKIKHSGSLPCGSLLFPSLTLELDHSVTVMSMSGQSQSQSGDQEGGSDVFPFQFASPHLRHIRKSNSVDSCLGTDMSSIKTSNGSMTGHPISGPGKAGGFPENLDMSQDSHSHLEDLKASIEEEVISNKDSGLGGSGGRSTNWYGSADVTQEPETIMETQCTSQEGMMTMISGGGGPSLKVEENLPSIEKLIFPSTSSRNNNQPSINQKSLVLEKSSSSKNIIRDREIYSADSDTESEIILSDQTSVRSGAESDTEDDTDGGDAVADRQNLGDDDDNDEDNTDDDKDNALLARMELDNLDSMEKPLIRTTCTQTNRSLFSSAWSNASSSTSTTTNGSASSYIDLEVISKKLPTGPPIERQKRNYLPSSSSSMNVKNDESKFKMSVSLPGNGGGGRLGRPTLPRKLQALHTKSVNDKEQRDLPALWANVRNRLDSKVSVDAPPSSDPLPMVRGDGILGESTLPTSTRDNGQLRLGGRREGGYQRPQHHNQHNHQHYLQSKVHNDDRIKRSLQRLSKLLDK